MVPRCTRQAPLVGADYQHVSKFKARKECVSISKSLVPPDIPQILLSCIEFMIAIALVSGRVHSLGGLVGSKGSVLDHLSGGAGRG